ncbi:MAG: HAD family hydrolase [Syntrophales bacterium]|jgi:putative hydrolase of the HAD superfamily|nr:HAD family hydrolase [Syntrophales bacterium]MCK9527399.1 HAD family hydrolase [Syntrophales bacterium]MDX9921501.1 HAD family hydrolase [Syntrophales bacterium]
MTQQFTTHEKLVQRYSQPVDPVPTPLEPKGSPKFPVRALLFDVYGTLFVSRAGDIGGAREEAEARTGELDGLRRRHGLSLPVRVMVNRFFDHIEQEKDRQVRQGIEAPEVVIEDIWGDVLETDDCNVIRRFALEFELIVNPVFPMPGLADLLSFLKKRGLTMGIISNAQFYTPILFSSYLGAGPEELGFRKDLIFFSYEMGYGKPSPKAFRAAAGILKGEGIVPREVLFIGNDMLKDILPAGEAGFQTVLFAGDARSLNLREHEDLCRGARPDMIITTLMQLADDNWYRDGRQGSEEQ